tara:strand:+ start:1611 stop:2732 length:1122 start_codon:yes stop_codon:yes gene_type:complete
MRLIGIIFLLLSFHFNFSQEEILKDPIASVIAENAVGYLNNFQFDEFDVEVEKLYTSFSLHPAYPLLKSMSLYYQSLINMKHQAEDTVYIKLLDQVVDYSEEMLVENENSKEGLFFALTGYGYRAQYYSDNGAFFKAVGEAKKAYKYYKKGRDYKDELNELYFMTGLFNYLIVQYPENHPMVKPLMGFFQKGDKQLGLEELDYGSKYAVFTKASCFSYSAYLNTKFEANYEKGVEYTRDFYLMYPLNTLNKVNYIMALLLNGNYAKSLNLIESLKKEDNKFYLIAYHLFEGWYTSHNSHDIDKAMMHLDIVELMRSENKDITGDIYALSCYKKAQLYSSMMMNDQAKIYYKKALANSSFTVVKDAYKVFQQNK